MNPKQIKISNEKLNIVWKDGSETSIALKYVRDECPCAGCKGETILLRTYRPPKLTMASPEMYVVTEVKTVGGYAMKIKWKDGHDTGIYSWTYLLHLNKEQDDNKSQQYKPLI